MKKTKLAVLLLSAGLIVCSVVALALQLSFARAGSGVTISDYWLNGGQEPWGSAFDKSGNVWMAIPGCDPSPTCSPSTPPGKIGEFNPSCSCWQAYYQLPSGYGQALFLAFDGSGNLWFPLPMSNSLGELVPSTGTISQWAVPTAGAGPWDLALDHSGNLWFTEHYTNQIGEFTPSTHAFHEIATPASNSQPYGIVVDGSDNVWFAENNSATPQIGEYTAGGAMNEYQIRSGPASGLTPHLMTIDPNGNIWWSEGWVGAIGELQVSAARPGTTSGVREFAYTPPCGSCYGMHTSGISVDSNGLVWFDDSLQNIIGSFPDSGSGSFSLYPLATANAHPHDGLNVDAHNVVWFDEEFGNKIGKAVQTGVPTPTPTTPAATGTTATSTATSSPSPTDSPSPSPSPTGGTVLAQDTFGRANQALWGTASDGQTWGGDANTQSVFSISANAGIVSSRYGVYNAVLGPAASDAEVLFSGSMSAFNYSNLGAVLRWTDANNWYKAMIDGRSLALQKGVHGSFSTLQTVPFAASGGVSYTIRFRVAGSTLSAKVWPTGTSEPSNWMITASDTTLTSGFCGLRPLLQSGDTVSITSFLADVPGASGSGSPTATTTTTVTATSTTTATTTATATATTPTTTATSTTTPTGGTVLAQDTFGRANQALWGTASDGQTWGGDANTLSIFSIANNAGLVTRTTWIAYSAVLGPSATNAEVYMTGSISSFTDSNFGPVLRWTDGNNWYKAYIDGGHLVIQIKVGGILSNIASVPFAAKAGVAYTIHFQVVGTTLSANAWAASGSEPAGWMVTASDSSLASGFCGTRVLTQGGTATITSFLAKSL